MNMRLFRLRGKWPERVGWMLIAGTLVYLALTWWAWASLDHRHPISDEFQIRAVALNSPIYERDRLLVRVTREKVRDDCSVVASRRAVDARNEVYAIGNEHWEGAPADDTAVTFSYATQHLQPGDYVLEVELTYLCPGDLRFELTQPSVPFEVRPADYVDPQEIIEELRGNIELLKGRVGVVEEAEEEAERTEQPERAD